MKTLLITLKGILLYSTSIIILLFLSGVDSIYDNGIFLHSIGVITILLLLCKKYLSKEDIKILTFEKYLTKIFEEC